VKGGFNPYAPFIRFVVPESNDTFTLNKAVRILSLIFGRGGPPDSAELLDFMKYLIGRVSRGRGRDVIFTLTAIKDLLKSPDTRRLFIREGGLKCFTPYLKADNPNSQSIYISGFAVWLLSFDKECLAHLSEWDVVTKLSEITKLVGKEKVLRISFAVLVNLLNQQKFNEEMVATGVHKTIDALNSRTWKDDDLINDMDHVKKDLEETIILLSSFEKYQSEILSGRLEWTPVHCEQFFRENSSKFEEKSFSLIKTLIGLLGSNDELTVEVACYDLGEFARFHPDGKRILTSNGGKRELMLKMAHKNAKIARQALLAVQKLMVTNWEFLSKNTPGGQQQQQQDSKTNS
jgi:V-type H+-transporting ATPase subunit H